MAQFTIHISDFVSIADIDEKGVETVFLRISLFTGLQMPILRYAAYKPFLSLSERIVVDMLGSADSVCDTTSLGFLSFCLDFYDCFSGWF